MQIERLTEVAHASARSKGFWEGRTEADVPLMLALIHSEVSEALEAHRKNLGDEALTEELADVVIRIADLCGGLDLDLKNAIEMKVRKNLDRPPLHGKRY